MSENNDVRFDIGDRVQKITGDYKTFGEVRCQYFMKNGRIRYVVEVEPQGFQMIWGNKELVAATLVDDYNGTHAYPDEN